MTLEHKLLRHELEGEPGVRRLREDTRDIGCARADAVAANQEETKMKYVLRDSISEQFLKAFDPDVHAPGVPYPTGNVEWTYELDEALKFDSPADALLMWKTQSKVTPTRPDGKPNRPLTTVTVTIERLNEEEPDTSDIPEVTEDWFKRAKMRTPL